MKYSSKAEVIEKIRNHTHTLSSLLTGISASLYCSKITEEKLLAHTHIDEAQQLAEEAERELTAIKKVLLELNDTAEPEKKTIAVAE